MPIYSVSVLTPQGEEQILQVDAPDSQAALTQLQSRGFKPKSKPVELPYGETMPDEPPEILAEPKDPNDALLLEAQKQTQLLETIGRRVFWIYLVALLMAFMILLNLSLALIMALAR